MIRLQLRDPQTGHYSDERWIGDDETVDPSVVDGIANRLLRDARSLDSTGHGVVLVAEVYGVRVEAAVGPTHYAGGDGQDHMAWIERAGTVVVGAMAVRDDVRSMTG